MRYMIALSIILSVFYVGCGQKLVAYTVMAKVNHQVAMIKSMEGIK